MANVVAGLTICTPLDYLWDKSIARGHCINVAAFYRYAPMPNIFTDLAMLLLPLPLIWRLQTSRSTKIGLTFTFLTGSMCVLIAPNEMLYSTGANESLSV